MNPLSPTSILCNHNASNSSGNLEDSSQALRFDRITVVYSIDAFAMNCNKKPVFNVPFLAVGFGKIRI